MKAELDRESGTLFTATPGLYMPAVFKRELHEA
jgi:hypothetical protein